jgi:hypothetical protein
VHMHGICLVYGGCLGGREELKDGDGMLFILALRLGFWGYAKGEGNLGFGGGRRVRMGKGETEEYKLQC